MILVSSCLLGIYANMMVSINNQKGVIDEVLPLREIYSLCPEQLGGLGTPRQPVKIIGGSGVMCLPV
jgi:uncharacterized protein YbbK (DUF523 family)